MKAVALVGFDDDRTKIPFTIPVKGGKPVTVSVPRFDYIDEDTFDEMTAELDRLDAEQLVINVAHDLADLPAGTESEWVPLNDTARKTLTDLGVEIKRVLLGKASQDNITAPTDEVLSALEPYSSQKVLPLRKRQRQIVLSMLKYVVTEEELALFGTLPAGALDDLLKSWREKSNVSLGESDASSTN